MVVILGLSSLQAVKLPALEAHGRTQIYLSGIVLEIALILYVWLLGLRPRHKRAERFGRRKMDHSEGYLADIGGASLLVRGNWLSAGDACDSWQQCQRHSCNKYVAAENDGRTDFFVGLSVTAGFCEEFLFRGYLQRQFLAWSGRVEVAVALQAPWSLDRPLISRMEGRANHHTVRRDVRDTGGDAEESAAGNDSARDAGQFYWDSREPAYKTRALVAFGGVAMRDCSIP